MKNWIVYTLLLLSIGGCTGKKSNDPQPAPLKADLILPARNEACTTGTILSATESKVGFKWKSAKHTDSYEITIKNLLTTASASHTVSDTVLQVTLLRNTPYSWYVVSKSGKVQQNVKSDVWKFYNAGAGAVSYAPFPAEIVSPVMAQNLPFGTGKINLDWNGSDADNDIIGYDIFFGTTNTPPLLASNLAASNFDNVTVTANTLYYWKVVTKDSKGNTSDSGIYEFKVN